MVQRPGRGSGCSHERARPSLSGWGDSRGATVEPCPSSGRRTRTPSSPTSSRRSRARTRTGTPGWSLGQSTRVPSGRRSPTCRHLMRHGTWPPEALRPIAFEPRSCKAARVLDSHDPAAYKTQGFLFGVAHRQVARRVRSTGVKDGVTAVNRFMHVSTCLFARSRGPARGRHPQPRAAVSEDFGRAAPCQMEVCT